MRNYQEKDIRFYDLENKIEGDFLVDETGDFALTREGESARQDMTNRIRTQTTDWRSHPQIGGDLELLEGEPNTRETGMKGVAQIVRTLTYDGRFDIGDIDVRAVPTSIEAIEFFATLDSDDNGPIVVTQPLEL